MLISNQQYAIEIIKSLSPGKIKIANDYLKYLKDKDEWEATQELSHVNILNEIKEGIKQIKSGQFVKFKEIRRDV